MFLQVPVAKYRYTGAGVEGCIVQNFFLKILRVLKRYLIQNSKSYPIFNYKNGLTVSLPESSTLREGWAIPVPPLLLFLLIQKSFLNRQSHGVETGSEKCMIK